MSARATLMRAAELAADFVDTLPDRPVRAARPYAEVLQAFDRPLGDDGVDPKTVIEELARDGEGGVVATAGPRYFGFVIGGSLPASVGAEVLAAGWDQNGFGVVTSPANAAAEEIAGRWLRDLLALPPTASVGFVTGGQGANTVALAAGRHHVLSAAGWDVEERGLQGAPPVRVIVGEEAHTTIFGSLRFLGLGRGTATKVAVDGQGRMRPEALAAALAAGGGPTLVCAQAGNVNTGAFDPLREIAGLTRRHGAWLHVDGAFGLWAAASPTCRPLIDGVELADSWATDAHKWLNVAYDSGLVFCAHPAAHRAATGATAAYYVLSDDRDPTDWVPEASRRARGFAVYAALRSLGRRGVAALVDRCCALARLAASELAAAPSVRVLNDVALNQVLVRFDAGDGADPAASDARTRAVVAGVQADGTCWLGGSVWRDQAVMRIAVSNHATSEDDVRRSVAAILRVAGGIS